ncbi:hypothetical protein [Gallaecimonas sp. GXIMD4217]|uniref:hypothetical protein n=1 Tax=Gallaecimonas sp. GXIMD4217 TaxID=3131927 RepID=UPI00311AD60C
MSQSLSGEEILSEDEKAFLEETFNQPSAPGGRWWLWLPFWALVLACCYGLFSLGLSQGQLGLQRGYVEVDGRLYPRPPSEALQALATELAVGSLVSDQDGQWVGCEPAEGGWRCRALGSAD